MYMYMYIAVCVYFLSTYKSTSICFVVKDVMVQIIKK